MEGFTSFFNITRPVNINKKPMYKIFVEDSALCWVIWLRINDMVFNNTVITPM
jgi:hypothetical protein